MTYDASSAAVCDSQSVPDAYTGLAPAPEETPQLSDRVSVECAVVGAGIAGCSAALHLAHAGKSVAQLEAGEISGGASGRAFGLVVPYGKHNEAHVLRHYGEEQGHLHLSALAEGPMLVRTLIGLHDIRNVLHGESWVLALHGNRGADSLRKRADFWEERGADVKLLDGAALEAALGSPRYSIGLKDNRAFTINPYAYALGLARAARDAGVKQFAQSPAVDIRKRGDGWEVATPNGRVHCQTVLVCTNAYSGGLSSGLQRSFVRLRGHQALTEPISESLMSQILPGAGVVTDTRHTWSGIKKFPGNRLHLSAGGPALDGSGSPDLRSVRNRLREIFPAVANTAWQSGWSGWVAITFDQFPRISRLGDGAWAAYGYNGRGLALATLMGRELARIAEGRQALKPFVPVGELRPLPFHSFGKYVAATALHWYRVSDWLSAGKQVKT